MRKTIAALLVTILASAGYVVLDKSANDRLIAMESQVSVQQSVIESMQRETHGTTTIHRPTEKTPEEMVTGDTLRCYPQEGVTLLAYYAETTESTTIPWSFGGTTKPHEEPTTTTSAPLTTRSAVRAQAVEPTAETITVKPSQTLAPDPTVSHETETAGTTNPPFPTEPAPTHYYVDYNNYTSLEPLRLDRFTCEMIGRSPLSVPQFRITLRARVNPCLAGKNVRAEIGETGSTMLYLYTTVADDGSIYAEDTVRLVNAQTILLQGVFLY